MTEKNLSKFDNDEILIDTESVSTRHMSTVNIYLYMVPLVSLIPPLGSNPGVKTPILGYFERKKTK